MSNGKDFELQWPIHGVADDQAHVKQRPLTTPEAKNVRTLVPGSARAQGGQRPGYADFTSAALEAGKRVQALGSVVVDLPKSVYSGFTSGAIDKRWGVVTVGQQACVAAATDDEDYVYVLDQSGAFSRYTREGELVGTYAIAMPSSERFVRRLELDRDGNVYVASTDKSGNYHSRVWKYEKLIDGDEEYFAPIWDFGLGSGIRDFRIESGQLILSKINPDLEIHSSFATIAVYDQLHLSSPTFVYERSTPWPVSGLSVAVDGSIYVSCTSNTARTEVPGGGTWSDPTAEWSPHELGDSNGSNASERLHFWVDAWAELTRLVDGEEVDSWWDRRWLHTSAAEGDVPSFGDEYFPGGKGVHLPDESHFFYPANDNARALSAHPWNWGGAGATGEVYPPIMKAQGCGSAPSIRFKREASVYGSRLVSADQSTGPKEDTDSPLDGVPDADGKHPSKSIVPDNIKSNYTIFFLFRFEPGDDAECIWFHLNKARQNRFGLIVNADERTVYPNQTNSGKRGYLTFYCDNVSDAGGPVASEVASVDLLDTELVNDRHVHLAALQVVGTVAENNANAEYNCAFRVDGRLVDTFTLTQPPLASSVAEDRADCLGAIRYADVGQDLNWTDWKAFNGDLMSIITVLGDTTTSANDWPPVSFPYSGSPWTQPTPSPYGSPEAYTKMTVTYAGNEAAYTEEATEVERLEGYLVHAYGCADILKSGAVTAGATYQDTHPFQDVHPVWGSLVPTGSAGAGSVTIGGAQAVVRSVDELLCKYSPDGTLTWAIDGFGHGLGCIAGPESTVYAVGQHSWAGAATSGHEFKYICKRVKDLGSAARETGDDTWVVEDGLIPDFGNYEWIEQSHGMAVDEAGHLYQLWQHQYGRQWLAPNSTTPLDGDVIQVGGGAGGIKNYTFKTALTPTAYEVLIGADADEAVIHLFAAINGGPFPGTWFAAATPANPDAKARFKYRWGDFDVLEIGSRVQGTGGNSMYCTRLGVGAGGAGVNNWYFETTQNNDGDAAYFVGGQPNAIKCRDPEDGEVLWQRDYGGDTAKDTWPQAIAIPQSVPDYNDDFDEGTADVIYVAVQNKYAHATLGADSVGYAPGDTLEKLELVQREQVIGKDASPRQVTYLAVCNGVLYRVAKGAAGVAVSGGGDLEASSPWIRMLTYRSKVYVFDGVRYGVYDPKTDEVEEWKVEQGGRLPAGAKLGCVWNGRIVLARTADDPHNLYMSARGNPDDWDTDPAVLSPLAAFSGSGSGNLHFRKHDLVNTLIPVRDDWLIVGGDSSVHRLTGDPGGQGQLDLLSDSEGLAFGGSWCKDPVGNVFVMGVNGGVYRFGVDGSMTALNEHNIERRLQDIDQSVFDIVMEWNIRFDGLHLYVVPKTDSGAVLSTHYWYDSKYDGWWPDTFADASVQPTCVATFDGDDPEDRIMAVGCEDGYVRFEDEDTYDDGDYPIHSRVFQGPLIPSGAPVDVKFSHLDATLDSRLGSVQVQVYVGEVADFRGDRPLRSWELQPGRSGYLMFKARGAQAWTCLNDATPGNTWALEQLNIRTYRAGRKRVR